jgi:hypothetical protein
MSVRETFVAMFGEDDAQRMLEATLEHVSPTQNPMTMLANLFGMVAAGVAPTERIDDNWGTDPFKYQVLAVIGGECVAAPGFRQHHGFELDPMEFYQWVVQHAELDTFDGDHPDPLAKALVEYDPDLNSMADLLLKSINDRKGETA